MKKLILILTISITNYSHADVFKCIDKQNKIHYQEQACSYKGIRLAGYENRKTVIQTRKIDTSDPVAIQNEKTRIENEKTRAQNEITNLKNQIVFNNNAAIANQSTHVQRRVSVNEPVLNESEKNEAWRNRGSISYQTSDNRGRVEYRTSEPGQYGMTKSIK